MKLIRLLAVLCALTLGLWLLRAPILKGVFDNLVKSEPPAKAEIAVVFGGDGFGHRILAAGQLVRDGYVPVVLVDGPLGFYQNHECDLAIPFAVAHGYPATYFRHFEGTFTNTADEAAAVIAELRKENIKKVVVVTSAFHTRRVSQYFAHLDGIEAHMYAASDEFANHEDWWKNREGRKTILLEWSKTVATWFGM